MPASPAPRWVEVSPSQFAHETEGLRIVRDLLPDQPPFRAWSNFEFRDGHGRWHEIDLLVLGRSRLHLVELKFYNGTLRGDDHLWLRDGHRAEDSPLKLARRKAQYLKTRLQDEFVKLVRERNVANAPPAYRVIPWLQESVFLHNPLIRCDLSEASKVGLYGLDGETPRTGLPGISRLLLEPADPRHRMPEGTLVELMGRIGGYPRRDREVGSWVIDGQSVADGEGWQEWKAYHKFLQNDSARIRFQIAAPGASEDERRRIHRIAEHEFTVMERLKHDGLLAPRDLIEADLGVGLIYPDDEGWQRLDLWLAERPQGIAVVDQLAILRKVGETLQYAHANRVVHRGIRPGAVWVRQRAGAIEVQVRDWQSAGRVAAADAEQAASRGVTALFDPNRILGDDDGLAAGAFAAPEGALATGVDRVRVDVFGLAALAFYLLAGTPPASSAATLRDRLRDQSGLDLAPELPQVSSPLRAAVLHATRPAVSERTSTVAAFLAELSEEERRDTDHEPVLDPLDAAPGAVLDGRFRLVRRLGSGSTAAGLLVTDLAGDHEAERVLKVALDDAAARRLQDEAEVLATLDSPRLVSLVQGPLTVGGRQALLLESAGTQTLAQAMSDRPRLSLDLLERWGGDLLEAVVALDRAGVDHRDIKPANLGVREVRTTRGGGDRATHLVLFDFSLSRAAAASLGAGTPPYLDPFLGTDGRDRYDSAAERYAAAAVLFEMATGKPPTYGDGLSAPAAIPDEATVREDLFDPAVAPILTVFFRQALARHATDRQHTAAELLADWQATFRQTRTTAPDNAEELIAAATIDTPLVEAGLSARALSALEPFGVTTVGDLVAVDPVRLNRLSGVAVDTKNQIKRAVAVWRRAYGSVIRRRGTGPWRQTVLPTPFAIADTLLDTARSGRTRVRPALVRLILGLTEPIDAFAPQSQLGARLPEPVTPGRVNQAIAELQESWAADPDTLALLTRLGAEVGGRLTALAGVATVDEIAEHLLTLMVADPESDEADQTRLATGLVRIVVDRQRALARADDDTAEYEVRRRDGLPVLIAVHPELLDLADRLGQEADRLVRAANPDDPTVAVVPTVRAVEDLARVAGGLELLPEAMRASKRLTELAAATSTTAAVSGSGELHHRGLPAARAVALTLGSLAAGQGLPASEIPDRVRARFPALSALPDRPRLDQVVADSGLDLRYDERDRVYRAPTGSHDTTGLQSRQPTIVRVDPATLSTLGGVGQRLADSLARRSFLALGTPAVALTKLLAVLAAEYRPTIIDLSAELIAIMRRQADGVGLAWAKVRSADAQPAGSRDAQGIKALADRSLPELDEKIQAALDRAEEAPVVLTDAAPLARYGAVGRLSRWTDLGTRRGRALWLVVPQLHATQGAMLDQRPIPLAAPGQFVAVDPEWVATHYGAVTVPVPEGSTA